MGINLADKGYNDVTAANSGEFSSLPAGGYVCKIINAEFANSKAGNLMLILFVDIAEGDFTAFFKTATDKARKFNADKKWDNNAIYRQLVLDSSSRVSPFFKGLISCIENSNSNFKININDFEPSTLRGLACGFVFALEEFQRRDYSIATRSVIKFPKSIQDIRDGKFSIPDIKKIDKHDTQKESKDFFGGEPVPDWDTPF